jgi:phage-related baseplate assembly protein
MSILPKAVEELSFSEILDRKKAKLKEIIPTIANQLVDSDPAIALLEESSYTEGLLRNRINNSINAVMLDYASGSDLENLGKLYGIERKLIQEEDTSTVPPTTALYEADEELRRRIMEAPKGFSVAGPKASYIYFGKLADSKIKDISAVSNTPMQVDITVLSYDGNGEATAELIRKVYEKLNAQDIRPMGDYVIVTGVAIVDFSIELQIIFKQGNVVDKEAIIEEIKSNLQSYVNSEHRLDGFISQAGIYSNSFVEHVEDVIIISPVANIKCTPAQAPYCSEIKIEEGQEA